MAQPQAKESEDREQRDQKERELRASQAAEAKTVFDRLKKGMKQIALYRHNVDRYGEYLEPFVTGMRAALEKSGMISVKIDAAGYKIGTHVVFEDESRDNNLIYPLWQSGVRLLIFKLGVTGDELQRFFLLCMNATDSARKGGEDIVTQLWKAELENIEYVVVEGFKVLPDEELEEVEIEIDKVVAYLYRQLQSNSDDYLRFARVSTEDLDLQVTNVDQMRGVVVQGQTATPGDKARLQQAMAREDGRQLQKMVTILFQLLELDTTEENFEDVAEAFVQLLDALILQENFTAIHQIRDRFGVSALKGHLSAQQKDMVFRASERFITRMGESQRVQTIGQIMNGGIIKDADGVRRYLFALGEEAIVPLLDMLESLTLLPNRRLVSDVLAELGRAHVETFVNRLNSPSSNLVKDMIYVIDRIGPPNKFAIFATVLEHPNAILRLETLAVIGKNPNDECFDYITQTLKSHPDMQMRAQAARMLPNFAGDKAAQMLLGVVRADSFEKMSDPEQKALMSALVQMQHGATDAYLREILDQKSGMFAKKRTDDMKLLAIGAMESNPSVPGLQLVATIAQDSKRHSKDVTEAARAAAINMKARLLGA